MEGKSERKREKTRSSSSPVANGFHSVSPRKNHLNVPTLLELGSEIRALNLFLSRGPRRVAIIGGGLIKTPGSKRERRGRKRGPSILIMN